MGARPAGARRSRETREGGSFAALLVVELFKDERASSMVRRVKGHIEKGVWEPGFVARDPMIAGSLRFKYLPATYEERQEYFDSVAAVKGTAKARRILGWLTPRV